MPHHNRKPGGMNMNTETKPQHPRREICRHLALQDIGDGPEVRCLDCDATFASYDAAKAERDERPV